MSPSTTPRAAGARSGPATDVPHERPGRASPVGRGGSTTGPGNGPPAGGAARALVLARVAFLPAAVAYGVAVVLAGIVAALASGTTPGGEPGLGQALTVGVPLWLVAHLVPLRLSGVPLSVLPLAPAVAVMALVAVVARGAARRLGSGRTHAGVPVVATATAAHAAIGVLAAALLTPDAVIDASPAQAGVVCGLLAGVAALTGVARPCRLTVVPRRLPAWVRQGLRAGTLAALLLLCAGAALLLATIAADAPAVAGVFERTAPEAGSGAGLAVLTVAYLPNAVIAAASWVMGPGVTVGLAAASPMGSVVAPLPPLPLFAAMPSAPPPSWAGLTFAVPLAVGSAVGWVLAPVARDALTRLQALVTAAVVAAVLLGLGAVLAGGDLGAGVFDPVSVPVAAVVGASLAWILVPGSVVALLAVPAAPGRRRPGATTKIGTRKAGTTNADPVVDEGGRDAGDESDERGEGDDGGVEVDAPRSPHPD